MANRCYQIDYRASNWKFPTSNYGKDSGSGKRNEWVYEFIRFDGTARRTDITKYYFAKDRVSHIFIRKNLNFLAPFDA